MRRLRLLVTLLACLLLGSALADGDATEPVAPSFSVLSNVTVTCSARLPAAVVGCMAERPVLVLGAFEVAIGIDAQAVLPSLAEAHLAPYAVLAWYADTWSAWAEIRLPELNGLHPLGDPDYLRIGVSFRL